MSFKRHPTKGGKNEMKGITPIIRKGILASYSSSYADITGIVHMVTFSFKKYGETKALEKAKLFRLRGLFEYHKLCLDIIKEEVKIIREKEGSG